MDEAPERPVSADDGSLAGAPDADADVGSGPHLSWGSVGALAALAYVAAVALDRILLSADGTAYNDVHRALDGPGARLVLALVLVAALFHALDGVRRMVVPAGDPREPGSRAVVAFTVGAAGVPLAVAVLWPWLGPVVS